MRILLDGYFDRNLGDDLMLTLAAEGLKEHELYVPSKNINLSRAEYTAAKSGFDAYVKVTGAGFQIYNTLGIFYRLRDVLRERKYAPQHAALSCSIDSPKNKSMGRAINKHLSEFDFITVRDRYSYKYIKENLPESNAEYYPDIVFSLPDGMISDTAHDKCLGIAIHAAADIEQTARVADLYAEETGEKTLLLCFDAGMENDADTAMKVYAAAKYKDRIEIIRYENITEMLSQIKRCACIVGIRFHSIILAARMGIPFVPVVYSEKTSRALEDMEYKGRVYGAKDMGAEEIIKSALDAKPFVLSGDIPLLAANHVKKFKEYIIKQQG